MNNEEVIKLFPFIQHLMKSNDLLGEAGKEIDLFISEGCKFLGVSEEDLRKKFVK